MSDTHAQLLDRVAGRLHELFDGQINLADVAGKAMAHQEPFFRTRALAALALVDEADLKSDAAGACGTDGGDDDGIDAVYVDDKRKILYFVQSKWRSGAGGVHLSEFTRFRDGVKSVISLNWTLENANLHAFRARIEAALKDIDTTLVMLLVHTCQDKISKPINAKITEFLKEQNKYGDFVSFKEIDLSQVVHIARSKTRVTDIDLTVLLRHWGVLTEPFRAVYGQVAATDVAKWRDDNGDKLFVENLRYVIEKSDVNEGIVETAEKEPEKFWYFNNGITAICESFEKQPIGGNATESGAFDMKKVSVINGAQTVGSLAKAKAAGADLGKVFVHARFISLAGTPEGFASAVTRSNNTQNDLNPVDFVSFDPNQDRLRKEAAQLGLVYSFRRGEVEPAATAGFTIRSATIAAACASGDLKLAVASKRYISGLWEDMRKEPYTKLFNENTTATYLWNVVRIMNAVDEELSAQAASLTGRAKLIAVHGNRFVLFHVVGQLDKARLLVADPKFSEMVSESKVEAAAFLATVIPQLNLLFPDSYPGNVFKNQDRQTELLNAIAAA